MGVIMTTIKYDGKQKSTDMKEYILNIASNLISELGIKETSLRKIADAADISKGTLYYHYPAKEDIIYDLTEKNLQEITDDFLLVVAEAGENISAREFLEKLFEEIIEAETRGKLHLYLLSEAITDNQSLAEKFEKRYASWRQKIRLSLDKVLQDRRENHQDLAYLILALLDGLIIQRMFGADKIPINQLLDLIL